jgi:hypothetical protein
LVGQNRRAASFIRIPRNAAGGFDRNALENAVRHGFRIVRWYPTDTEAARVMQVPGEIRPEQPGT